MINTIKNISVAVLLLLSIVSCKKYLETKSNQNLSTPSTLEDLEMILDNPQLATGIVMDNTATDEIYLDEAMWQAIDELLSDGYIWKAELNDFRDWSTQYNSVFYANTVLDNLTTLQTSDVAKKDKIRGAALFVRAHAFYQIAKLYAPQYNATTANADLGIPLRMTSDFNQKSTRATVQETYDQIINDLVEAATLLPTATVQKFRPSKASCYGLLARVNLDMGNYAKAEEYSSLFLQINSDLIDYNTIDPNGEYYPFGIYKDNKEIIYYYTSSGLSTFEGMAKVDSNLYKSYMPDDLRKLLFFVDNGDGTFSFKGKYTGDFYLFTGIATDEIYLIRAEANARLNNVNDALDDLNNLAQNRYDKNSFVPFAASTGQQALELILAERRKELISRGTRWSDLKRFNQDTQHSLTLKRVLGSSQFELPPNDARYTLLIPREVINKTDISQNPR